MRGNQACALLALALAGCSAGPSPNELARLREQARAEDARLRAVRPAVLPYLTSRRDDETKVIDLSALAQDSVITVGPAPDTAADVPHRFRGPALRPLIGDAEEVTLIGDDGWWTTLRAKDLDHVILATRRDELPIPRSLGGPITGVLPFSLHPALRTLYGENGWCFYVSAIVTGRPKAHLLVEGKELDVVGSPRATRTRRVRFRTGWPSGDVPLHGVTLASLTQRERVDVWSLGRTMPTRVDVKKCDAFVVLGSLGDEPIAPRMGGPILLALEPQCDQAWPGFVERIEAAP